MSSRDCVVVVFDDLCFVNLVFIGVGCVSRCLLYYVFLQALILIFSVLTKRFAGKSVSNMTYLVSSVTLNLNPVNPTQYCCCHVHLWAVCLQPFSDIVISGVCSCCSTPSSLVCGQLFVTICDMVQLSPQVLLSAAIKPHRMHSGFGLEVMGKCPVSNV